MPTTIESEKLKSEQYHNVNNLAARIRLHERFSTSKVNLFQWLFDHLLKEIPQKASILEIGCGRGDLWKQNMRRIPRGWTIKLTDYSPGMLEDCKRHLGKDARRFEFDTVDAQAIPYSDARFDAVIADFMLYHVANRPEALREIRRVLRPMAGKLFAATVGDAHLRELDEIARRFAPDAPNDLSAAGFTLQNGADQLALCFPRIRVETFPDSLYVTELQPLLDYLASSNALRGIESEKFQKQVQGLKEQFKRDGGISIQKQSGLFIASN